ncbi:MAG: AAA family ATPase [Sedimentisphaeraceae bacterium JB056]
MDRPTLKGYIKENSPGSGAKPKMGPFVTISREFGCSGYELADILANKLNEMDDAKKWKVYRKEILRKLADESGYSVEAIEKARTEKTGFLYEILKNVRVNSAPDTFQVRSQIAAIVRKIAVEGHSIIVGQGGAAATADMENGLSVRIEAPESWRLQRVCRREQLSKDMAAERLKEVERTRHYLRQTYSQANPKTPAFNMTLDNSVFTAEQVADQIILAMKHCEMIVS